MSWCQFWRTLCTEKPKLPIRSANWHYSFLWVCSSLCIFVYFSNFISVSHKSPISVWLSLVLCSHIHRCKHIWFFYFIKYFLFAFLFKGWCYILSVMAHVQCQPTHHHHKFPLTCWFAQGDPRIDSNLSSLGVCVFCIYVCVRIFEPIPLHASLKATSLE